MILQDCVGLLRGLDVDAGASCVVVATDAAHSAHPSHFPILLELETAIDLKGTP